MRALAFWHEHPRLLVLAQAFKEGCRRHGVDCELLRADQFNGVQKVDVIFIYGLGVGRKPFDAYAGRALRIVSDLGYFRELMPKVPRPERYVRVAINSKQPDAHLRLRPHPRDRFDAMRLAYEPVKRRGDAILVCGHSERYARELGLQYGDWERGIVEQLRAVTGRPIVMREKPKNPKIEIPGIGWDAEKKCRDSIRSSWAVVCRSGNVGADCVLHGIPVFAEIGPGAVYGMKSLAEIDRAQPLSAADRMAALSDLAYWHWQPAEIAAGKLWAHLKNEGLL